MVSTRTSTPEGVERDAGHVRFGSKADMCGAKGHVRFAPNSDRESGHPQTVMSALPLKADMCGATRDVCFGPKADIRVLLNSPSRRSAAATYLRWLLCSDHRCAKLC